MTSSDLQTVASTVLRRAQKNGFVVAKEIRADLQAAGLPEERWKEVVEMLRESLNYRQGRYYYLTVMRPHHESEANQREQIEEAVEELLSEYHETESGAERRQTERREFNHTVKVHSEDKEEFTALSKDLSPRGIRLITDRSLLGRKLFVHLPHTAEARGEPLVMVTRILWTTVVADGVFENGGAFLEVLDEKRH